MVIPHLLFAHMLGDYVLQTNWLVSRKGKTWYGLGLHGGIVGLMSLLALAPYFSDVWPLVLGLTVIHTVQDYLKVRYGPHMNMHPFIPYIGDQLLHYLAIGVFQLTVDRLYTIDPGQFEVTYMWVGTAVLTVTRYYDVTWWSNWLDMLPYMNRWRVFGYVERLSIATLTFVGAWYIAPFTVIPRLLESRRQQHPIWQQRRGVLEVATAIIFSMAIGLGLKAVL